LSFPLIHRTPPSITNSLIRLFVLDDCCGETSCGVGPPVGVDGARPEVGNYPDLEKQRHSGGGVAHHAQVDVAVNGGW